MIIEGAVISDVQEILWLQKLSYLSEADIYDDYTIPPLLQTLAEIEAEYHERFFLKATRQNLIIGSVRAHMSGDTCCIGRLIVHPYVQNRGIGTFLMTAIERHFDYARRYELFTGKNSEKNLYLYRKLGYEIFKRQALTEKVPLVFMEKVPGG